MALRGLKGRVGRLQRRRGGRCPVCAGHGRVAVTWPGDPPPRLCPWCGKGKHIAIVRTVEEARALTEPNSG
jgi:rubrerythrin